MNFIVAELGDNDYGTDLMMGIRTLIDETGGEGFCPTVAKVYLTEFLVARCVLRGILNGRPADTDGLRLYFGKLRVTFRDKLPTFDVAGEQPMDHDGGSAYYDVHTDRIYNF